MAIKENVLPLAQSSGSGTYIRTLSSGGESQRASFDIVKGAITADMDDAIEAEAEARESADTQLETELNSKVDKVTGKGLSTNDFTNALKTKLDGIEAGAEVNIIETVKVNGTALVPDANRAVNVPAPTVDSALSTTSENPVQNKVVTGAVSDLKEEISDKPNWTVGSAEQLVSDEASQTDVTTYTFRRSGGGLIPFNFTREELSKVVGGTVAWNQLANSFISRTALGVTITADNSRGSITVTGTATATNNLYFRQGLTLLAGHKYLLTGSKGAGWLGFNDSNVKDTGNGNILEVTTTTTRNLVYGFNNGDVLNEVLYPCLTDLTAMLGTTIADYIYSLETATAGSGIAKLREWGFFRDSYYAYDPGSLKSVCVGAHSTTEKNLLNVSQGEGAVSGTVWTNNNGVLTVTGTVNSTVYRIIGSFKTEKGVQYTLTGCPTGGGASKYRMTMVGYGYDYGNGYTFTGDGESHDVSCDVYTGQTLPLTFKPMIRFSSADATFVPYQKHTYALDSTKTLRGIFKLDSSNRLYCDGDEYGADGTVTRNTILRAYQSGDESLANAITDGTNTVVYSANASTETADPYTAVQICDSDGTEEFVDALVASGDRDVAIPAGTETVYYEDMAGKLAELPPIPSAPSANGTYTLQAVVSSGAVTYQWTS